MKPIWQISRGQLNHNWLQNGVLIALNHAVGVVAGTVRTRNARQTLAEDVKRWEEREEEVPAFLDRFEDEMSPKIFFQHAPLSRCSDETPNWLIPLTHELWLKRENVKEKVGRAREAYELAVLTYRAVCAELERLSEAPTAEDIQRFSPALREFTGACEALSRAISAFPHEVRCV